MICRWGSSVVKKMILPAFLLVIILIRQSIGSYHDGYGPKEPMGVKQQHHQAIHQQSRTIQHQAFSSLRHLHPHSHPHPHPHPHRHHHENIYNGDREMHIKPQHLHLYRNRDYQVKRPTIRPTTTTTTTSTTTTPRTVPRTYTGSWKWRSTTPADLGLPELAHIKRQNANETNADSIVFKNRLSSGERQQWSANNKQIFIGLFPAKMNNKSSSSTDITKTASNHVDRSFWSHYSHTEQQNEEAQQRVEDNHRTLLEKATRIVNVDPGKIRHEDERVKNTSDNKEDYDHYYAADDDESEKILAENKVLDTHTKAQQDVLDNFNYDYLDDEPGAQSDEQNQNSFKVESLTEEKWKNYGTAEAVERSRRRYNTEGQSAATAHIQRIKEESRCRWPHPKVITVTEASKRFVPHCTILHRCGDDTGCCDYDTKTCIAKSMSTVHLHFFVIPLGGSVSVEVRSFVNHTECHCVDRCILSSCIDSGGGNTINYGEVLAASVLSGNETCRCPSHFNVVQDELSRGRCRCDCSYSNQACNILKRGQDGFPGVDQECIKDEKCKMPTCQYGQYSTYTGRCPKVKHQKRTISPFDYR